MAPDVRSIGAAVARPINRAARLTSRPLGLALGPRALGSLNPFGRRALSDAVRDRVIVVTGASSGIGRAAALKIGAAGGTVVLVARSADKLEELAGEIADRGGLADPRPCDLGDYEAIDTMIDAVLAEHGHVDVLVNNAGRSIRRSVELSYRRFHDFERTMQLNYFASVRLILKVLPGMRERQGGHIVNVSSAGVQTRVPRFSGYIASKAALDTFSDAVQAEVLDDNVRFTTIHMPLVRTPMISPTKLYDRFPALTPDEAASLICEAIIHRHRRIGPPFGYFAALADAVSPEAMDVVRNIGFRTFPDSRAARGDGKDDPSDARAGRGGDTFARLTRGIHW